MEQLLLDAERAHGHLCAGQILGVRMAMLGCARLGIEEPRGRDRKRLVTFVEIDRCATDAIGVVTGCRLGKRALKLRDWGKMAATFIDLADGRACASRRPRARKPVPASSIRTSRTRTGNRCMPTAKCLIRSYLPRSGYGLSSMPRSSPATRGSGLPVPCVAKAYRMSAGSGARGKSCATDARSLKCATTSRFYTAMRRKQLLALEGSRCRAVSAPDRQVHRLNRKKEVRFANRLPDCQLSLQDEEGNPCRRAPTVGR